MAVVPSIVQKRTKMLFGFIVQNAGQMNTHAILLHSHYGVEKWSRFFLHHFEFSKCIDGKNICWAALKENMEESL